MELQEYLSGLKKNKKVYIYDSPVYQDRRWSYFQEKEKAFWRHEINRPSYNPNPKEHIMPSLKNWGIDSSYFKDKSVLEIGSGPYCFFSGILEINRKHLPKNLVISDSLMDFFQDFEVSKLIPENAIRLQAPGEDMPLPDRIFDIILTNNTLDHVKDCDDFLREIRRMLKAEGRLLFSAHAVVQAAKILIPLIKKIDSHHPYHFVISEIENLFNRNGLHLVSLVGIPLYKEESIPPELNSYKKCIYKISFYLMQTVYGIAKLVTS